MYYSYIQGFIIVQWPMGRQCSLYLSQSAIMGVKKDPELAKRAAKIRKIFRLRRFYGNLVPKISWITCNRAAA